MSRPAVSILLPCRDAERTLPAALRSIFSQTVADFELVAVDDGSRDRTGGILDRSGAVVLHTPPRGIAAALRLAAETARGDLFARMDADDVMRPARLERQIAAMDGVDVLATRVTVPRSRGMAVFVRWQNSLLSHEEIVNNLFVDAPIAHPTVMMRRSAYERAGGYREGTWAEDFDLWHRMARAGARFAKLPDVLLRWTDRPDRLTRRSDLYSRDAFYAAKKHYLLQHPFLRPPVVVWGAGPIGRRWARDLLAAGIEVAAAIDIDPRKIGRRICVDRVPVVSPEEGVGRGVILGAVGSRGAREAIRKRLLSEGLREGSDFIFVA